MANLFEEADPVEASYAVRPDTDVSISVVIGNGQFGTIRVRLDGNKIAAGRQQVTAVLGKGSTVTNKTVDVISVVDDVNPSTNRTVVTYTLAGGAAPQSFQSDLNLANDWGVALHTATFQLAKL